MESLSVESSSLVKPSSSSKLKYTYKTVPFSHQKKALAKLLKLDGKGGLLMEMGTGKTKVAIDWAGIGFYNWGLRRVLVVAPLSVLGVWPKQIKLHGNTPARLYRLQGSTFQKVKTILQVTNNPDDKKITYMIINYESIWRETSTGESVEEALAYWAPDLVIFDESHRLKTASSKQSKAAYRIARGIPQRLILSGTPITKSPLDAFAQFRSVDDTIFGNNWYRFKNYFGVWGGFHQYQLRGYRHIKELVTKIRDNSFRIKKVDCLDLPPKVSVDVPVTLSARAIRIYKDMAEQMIAEISENTHATAPIVLVKLLRLSQITSGFIKDVDGKVQIFDDSKLKTTMDLLSDLIEDGHKVVIFCRFIVDIQRLAEAISKLYIQFRILSGSVTGPRRDSIIEEFQDDKTVKVLLAQIQSGSEGIDLYAADAAIYYSLSYSALNYWQSQDRLHRQGQTKKCTYYHMIVPRSIDSVVLKVLEEKGKLAEKVIHDPSVLRMI